MAARASQVSEPSRREAPRALPLVFFAGSAHGVLCSLFHPLLRMNELFVECIVGLCPRCFAAVLRDSLCSHKTNTKKHKRGSHNYMLNNEIEISRDSLCCPKTITQKSTRQEEATSIC